MNSLEVRQIYEDIDKENFKIMTKWMHEWWGIEDGYSQEEIECFMKNSFQKSRLPQTYGLFLDNKIIGIYQFTYEDLSIRSDIYPWFANVYIYKKYRNKGYAKIMLYTVIENAKKVLDFDELYLYTEHI